MDHNEVIGACVNCHMQAAAHIPTTLGCDICHVKTSWIIVSVDHNLFISQTCTTYHTKSLLHANTTDLCQACHVSTASWLLVNMNHNQVITCAERHPLPGDHDPVAQDCSA